MQYTHASRYGAFNTLYSSFWRKFKQSPELFGCVNIVVTDIIGDRPYFTDPTGNALGRNKRLEAERYWKQNRVKETLKAILFDEFVTGDGYGWKAVPTPDERARAVKEAMGKLSLRIKEGDNPRIFLKAMQDEDLKRPKRFDYVASSTMMVNSTEYDIVGYTQVSNGKEEVFSPEEIIHFRLNTMNGGVQGFSPVESLIRELALMYYVKGNMLAYMQNGGKPDVLFSLKNSNPGTPSYESFNQQLQSFVSVETSQGYLLGTGEVDVKDLSFGKERDMEYQNLALWVLSGMLFAFGIPVSRVPYLIGKSATAGDSGGLAEAGYQSVVSEKQDEVEDLMNYQLFEPMGWHMHLSRHYKQDEVREAQAMSMNADTVSKMLSIYSKHKKKLSLGKINQLLDVADDDLEEMSPEDVIAADPLMRNQNLLDNQSVMKNTDNQKRADTKRNVANDNANKGARV